MSSNDPPYTCHKPWPKAISDDPDITGYGVVANYMATAGIAVIVILVYFCVIYDPAVNPFKKRGEDPPNLWFRPNPVDEIFLQTVRYLPRHYMGKLDVSYQRIERLFIRCTLAMSDAQLITGLSILISGFVQLPQGLPSYHWMAIIDLSWFSSITHLACLTILRNYLHNHSVERIFRLVAMGGLATLLVIGLSFTSTYWWASTGAVTETTYDPETATLTHAAICHMSVQMEGPNEFFGYIPMIFSILLVVFGFSSRLIKLHRLFSVNFLGCTRLWMSSHARRILRIIFIWCSAGSGQGLKRSLLYRPLLAVFFSARLLLDIWSSMLLEVGWLLGGFVWGSLRLMSLLLQVREVMNQSSMLESPEDENKRWGFGQVVSIVLLLAPFVTFAGFFNQEPGEKTDTTCSYGDQTYELYPFGNQSPSSATLPTSRMNLRETHSRDLEDPDSDWKDHAELLGASLIYVVAISIALITYVFFFTTQTSTTIVMGLLYLRIPIVIGLINILEFMLFSLLIELEFPRMPPWGRKVLHLLNIVFSGLSTFSIFILEGTNAQDYVRLSSLLSPVKNYWFIIVAACFYVLCAITSDFVGRCCHQ